MTKFENKTLLVIGNGYPSHDGVPSNMFVKAQVDELKNYFRKIIVIAPLPWTPTILNKLHFLKNTFPDNTVFKDYKYDNVEVYYPKYYTLPLEQFRTKNGDYAYKVVLKCLVENSISFDLIHAHFTWTSGYVGALLKQKFDKKLVVTIHRNRAKFLQEYYSKNPKFEFVWSTADKLIRVNNIDVPLLKKYNENTVNIPNGFDSSLFKKYDFDCKQKLYFPEDKKILLNVANYTISHKNQLNLINALHELYKIRQDFVCYLIGNNSGDRHRIEEHVKKKDAMDYVKIIGPLPHDEIPLWMNAADLFVLPSYSESFGVVNIEALACGTPVVSTNNGGSEEIITSTEYGFLLKNPNDYHGLSELLNDGLLKKWDYNKILKYSKRFEWNIIKKEIINEYKKVL